MSFIKNISSSASDSELVTRYKQTGDLTVLGQLYQRYMDLVYGVGLLYLKDGEEAKDSTLAVFEELIDKLKKHEVQNFKAWLYQLAKNHCLMKLRKDRNGAMVKTDIMLMQIEDSVHLNGELEKEENLKQLDICMKQLPPAQQQVIQLFYLQGKCYKEIAQQTGLDWNKIRSYIQNGRRNLKICMDKRAVKECSHE